jgi:nicotinamidase-related amidase
MSVTTLDPRTALIVIDLQKGIVGMPTAHPINEVVKHASALVEAFHHHDLPVVLVNVEAGAPGRTEQAPRVRDFPAGWTDLTQVVIAGVATSAGVESTARQAHEFGFNVTLAIDAMTDMSLDAHRNSITRIFPRMSETGTTEEIIALLNNTRA